MLNKSFDARPANETLRKWQNIKTEDRTVDLNQWHDIKPLFKGTLKRTEITHNANCGNAYFLA